jgi:hypothetical protein
MKLAFVLFAASNAVAQCIVPRPAPELQITETSGSMVRRHASL